MSKKTKHQRYYAKQKKDSKKDFRYTEREDGKKGVRVTRVSLCVRVNSDASQKLIELSESESIPRWKMLTRIILVSIPKYQSIQDGLVRYSWPDRLLNPEEKKVWYKGETGECQINARITSTAWNKLECHSNATELSKARIIQFLILNYTLTSESHRKRNQEYRDQDRAMYGYVADRMQPSAPKEKKSKFVNQGGQYVHRKGIPIESWDEEEYDEYLELMNKKEKSNPIRIEGEE